jgi:putative hydrolase of the HAD superfamily
VHAGLDLLPVLRAWLDEARQRGIRLAIASSSPSDWVMGHLRRVGAEREFEVWACGNEIATAKPISSPWTGVASPDEAVAVQDTPHGVAAAKAADMVCIAIPNPFAASARFAAADLVLAWASQLSLSEALQRLRP